MRPDCYCALQVTTNFSFLRGASHPEEMVQQAVALGYSAIAMTDRNTLAGIVRGHAAAKKAGIKFIPACRLDLQDGPSLLAFPTNIHAYNRLSGLLSLGNLRTEKGKCHLYRSDVYAHAEGMKFIIVPPSTKVNEALDLEADFKAAVQEYRAQFGQHVYLSAVRAYDGHDSIFLYRIFQLSASTKTPVVATNDVHYHEKTRRELHDMLTCIREKCTIQTAGFRLHPNAEKYMKPVDEMIRLFLRYPAAIWRAQEVADACTFSLDEIKYRYPKEVNTSGRTSIEQLRHLAWEGAKRMYGENIPDRIRSNIEHEMTFIEEMNYAEYFLTVEDIVRFARSKEILCQGRGSAANSTVCYCLGITSVDPTKFDLLFERFISSARNEPPDIDVDFEHERREEVMQYIYSKYGRDRAGIVATVTQVHQKGAIRDVGKAMGLSVDTIERLSKMIWGHSNEWFDVKRIKDAGLNPDDFILRKTLELTAQYMGFPRQLGQHTGGFVITDGKLTDLCPILNARMENRTNIEWNKDDIDALGFLKIDVLALGMLTCIRKAFDLTKRHYNRELTLANVPQDDPAVYEMISNADTIGVFQIESRAQQSMLPRLRPKEFYDLVIEVAIVRPGPIQGDMVHPYLRRRNGEEPVEFPSEEIRGILGRTLGVPLFQEQAMKIAIVAAGFTPAEADQLRRSMATFKVHGMVKHFEQKLITGMTAKGYTKEYAQRVFKQLEGFGSYGFPESHAASFALLVYVSAWIKCHLPDVFATALLNSMPMGFYQPAEIVIDARQHGVEVRPVDVNYSQWDNVMEERDEKYHAVRLGFRQVTGMRQEDAEALIKARKISFATVDDLRIAGIPAACLERLADADAFNSLGLDRRQALWALTVKDQPQEMFHGRSSHNVESNDVKLPKMTVSEHVVHDYVSMSLSLKAHPLSFIRKELDLLRITPVSVLPSLANGDKVTVAGLVLVRQRPGTASGVCFITIQDETGIANLVVWQSLFDKYRKEILLSRLLMIEGTLQREGQVIHVIAKKCSNLNRLLGELVPKTESSVNLGPLSRADKGESVKDVKPGSAQRDVIQGKIFPDGRNFR
ncbi:error-prone DNA polymerase [Parachryseolinea silvisoli]|uniref:error-prone DNA polymerase n=1 Tax=Parachryseolinea silvisoli TaxID=2873601 RepID=UPI002265E854|nr:error-prone DNA polymerase [Parachryseolinea silvisoli]MCD9015208.1 error-prone DNA polymerase [Parachryseolinea silvisoli]